MIRKTIKTIKTIKASAVLALLLGSATAIADYPIGVQDSFIIPNTPFGAVQNLDVLNNDSGENLRVVEVNDWTVNGGRATIFQGPYYQTPFGRHVRYIPKIGFTGEDSFWYVFEDAQGRKNAARVVVNVLPVSNTPYPNPRDDTASVQKNKTIRLQVLENDVSSPEFSAGGTHSITAFSETSAGGQVKVVPGSNSLSYTPPKDFTGDDQFTYTVSVQTDRFAFATKQATVKINVTDYYTAGPYPYSRPDNAIKAAGTRTASIYPLDNDVGRGLRISNSGLSYSFEGGQWYVSGGNDKQILYTAPNGFTGEDKIYYILEDELGRKNWGVVTINVQ